MFLLWLWLWLWLLKGIFMRQEVRTDWRKTEAEPGREIMAIRIRAERTGAPAPDFPARRAAVLLFRAGTERKEKPRLSARVYQIHDHRQNLVHDVGGHSGAEGGLTCSQVKRTQLIAKRNARHLSGFGAVSV